MTTSSRTRTSPRQLDPVTELVILVGAVVAAVAVALVLLVALVGGPVS